MLNCVYHNLEKAKPKNW